MTTKLWKIAERPKPPSGREGDHEVVEGACVSVPTTVILRKLTAKPKFEI